MFHDQSWEQSTFVEAHDFSFFESSTCQDAHQVANAFKDGFPLVATTLQFDSDLRKELGQEVEETKMLDLKPTLFATELVCQPHQRELHQTVKFLL